MKWMLLFFSSKPGEQQEKNFVINKNNIVKLEKT